jgi:T5orf172 domain
MGVYVISVSEEGPCKIGISAASAKRLRTLQTGSHVPLSLHHNEPTNSVKVAAIVENAAHRMLANDPLVPRGGEWFNVAPKTAGLIIRSIAAAANIVTDKTATFREMDRKSAALWVAERDDYQSNCEETDSEDYLELDGLDPPSVVELFACSLKPSLTNRLNFNEILICCEGGDILLSAFSQMGQRRPSGRRLKPYLEASNFIRLRDASFGGNLIYRWMEYCVAGRALTSDEVRQLAQIWNRFVQSYNLNERDDNQFPTRGLDDQVDDVHLLVLKGEDYFGLTGEKRLSDRQYVLFRHEKFQAVIVIAPNVKLICPVSGGLLPLGQGPLTGFVIPVLPYDIWDRPIQTWIQNAPQECNAALAHFLDKPCKRYPAPHPYDSSKRGACVEAVSL